MLGDDRRERVAFARDNLEHLPELLLEHEPALVGGRLGVVLVERVADLGDEPLARGQAANDAALGERRVGVGAHQQPPDMSPGASLASLR